MSGRRSFRQKNTMCFGKKGQNRLIRESFITSNERELMCAPHAGPHCFHLKINMIQEQDGRVLRNPLTAEPLRSGWISGMAQSGQRLFAAGVKVTWDIYSQTVPNHQKCGTVSTPFPSTLRQTASDTLIRHETQQFAFSG